MSGLATNKRISGPGGRRRTALSTVGAASPRSTGLAPTWVMPPGTGLTIPRLDGIPQQYYYRRGEQHAAHVASALLRAGVAKADDWCGRAGNPVDFLKRALERWVADHGGEQIRQEFHLHLSLTTLTDYAPYRDEDTRNPDIYLVLEPESAGYVVLGPVLRLLEREHPRLPVTFVHLFTGALNRWVRVWDWRDALDRVDRLREWYDTDIEAGEAELPDVERDVPPCMKRRPLTVSGLRRLRLRDKKAQQLVTSVLELDTLSPRGPQREPDESLRDLLVDCGEPLPALLVVFEKHDVIEGQFDEESQGMLEVTPEPNVILRLESLDAAQTQRLFDVLAGCCATLAQASRLVAAITSLCEAQSVTDTSGSQATVGTASAGSQSLQTQSLC